MATLETVVMWPYYTFNAGKSWPYQLGGTWSEIIFKSCNELQGITDTKVMHYYTRIRFNQIDRDFLVGELFEILMWFIVSVDSDS